MLATEEGLAQVLDVGSWYRRTHGADAQADDMACTHGLAERQVVR